MVQKKYLINVDFPTTSKIHLNPEYFGQNWCRLDEIKQKEDGGKVYATSEQAQNYLKNKETLYFNGKPVNNLVRCKKCSVKGKHSKHWDVE